MAHLDLLDVPVSKVLLGLRDRLDLLGLLDHKEQHLQFRGLRDLRDRLGHKEQHQLYLGLRGLRDRLGLLGRKARHLLYLDLLEQPGLLGLLDHKVMLDLPALKELVFNSKVLLHL
jgi:hypothetical protein